MPLETRLLSRTLILEDLKYIYKRKFRLEGHTFWHELSRENYSEEEKWRTGESCSAC